MAKRHEPEYVAQVVAQITLVECIPDGRFKSGYREQKQIGMGAVVGEGHHQLDAVVIHANRKMRQIGATAQVSIGHAECWSVVL